MLQFLASRGLALPASGSAPQNVRSLESIEHGWHDDLMSFVQTGLPKILFALLIAFIAHRVLNFFVRRMRRRADALVGNSQRAAQLRTVAGIIRATAIALIGAYLLLEFLSVIGVSLGPFIASAGVIGLGISFGAQSLFKDMLNGIFILIEDQYNVGDVVKIAGLQGTVEDLTLRCTKLRDGDGTLYIVPNSQIATVSNLSRDFSVASLTVSVSPAENPDRVIATLQSLAEGIRADDAFRDIILADPSVLGVDKISAAEVLYPITLRVRANQRDGVLRALRRRILLCFEQEGIALGTPGTVLIERKDPTAPPAQANGVSTGN